jgi:hypothetical protein
MKYTVNEFWLLHLLSQQLTLFVGKNNRDKNSNYVMWINDKFCFRGNRQDIPGHDLLG